MVAAFGQIFCLFLNTFEEFVDVIFPFFLGLPIALLVLYSGFHSAAFINHLSLGDVAILIASHHLIFCVLFQHLVFTFLIFTMASLVLLLM